MLRFLVPAVLLAALAFAQAPVFEAGKVQIPNSNDTTPLGPGELISIYGSYLGPETPCQGREDPNQQETPNPRRSLRQGNNLRVFPKELCGVRVLVGGEPAGLLYVHRDQINFKVPQNVPMEGTVGLQVVHRAQASAVVQIEAGLAPLRLILPERAFTNMPIWVRVEIPPNRASPIRYPYPMGPWDIGCNELLVRKDGRLLETMPVTRQAGGAFAGQICGSSSLGDRYENRLPLHMRYRIEEPGDYEVRLSIGHAFASGRVLTEAEVAIQSEWMPLRVEASADDQRRDWLTELTRNPPASPEELIGDYLPSILGVPDERSLEAVVEQLYHPHSRVTWFAQGALGYWPAPDALSAVKQAFERKGPSSAVVRWLLTQRTNGAEPLPIIEASLPYLRSSDPVALQGAVSAVRSLGWLQVSDMSPDLSTRIVDAMIASEKYVLAAGDHETSQDYVQGLAIFRDDRTRPILWRFVDEGIALGASLDAIARIARPEDLPKLAAFIGVEHMPRDYYYQTNSLLGTLVTAYQADALPYVKRVIQETDNATLRDVAGSALVEADLPEVWAFIAEAIAEDAPYKADVMRHIAARYPASNATEAAMLALAKRLAAGQKP